MRQFSHLPKPKATQSGNEKDYFLHVEMAYIARTIARIVRDITITKQVTIHLRHPLGNAVLLPAKQEDNGVFGKRSYHAKNVPSCYKPLY